MRRLLAWIWKKLGFPANFQLWIMRRFQDQFLVGVTGVIFNDKQEVLLFRHTYRAKDWGLPGGYIKATEHPKEGLEREILEESGFVISADERSKIRTDRDNARLDIVYTGTFLGGTFRPSDEVTEAGFFSFDKLPEIRVSDLHLISRILEKSRLAGQPPVSVSTNP